MFTGIVTGIGTVLNVSPILEKKEFVDIGGKTLTIQAPPQFLDDIRLGDSIALSGACMTVTSFDQQHAQFTIDISAESLARTVGLDQKGGLVNLEKALLLGERLGGHLVTGHVDGVGKIKELVQHLESYTLKVLAPVALARYLAYKGSVTINGVSLTINEVVDIAGEGALISINLIPHTMEHTTFHTLQAGDQVNLEVDLIARYLDRIAEADAFHQTKPLTDFSPS